MSAGRGRGDAAGRAARPEEARERLLEAAVHLFGDKGYAATSVGEICDGAKVARTALYWHFGSKEGLLAAVLERVGGRWIEEIQKAVYAAPGPVERLDRLTAAWRQIVLARPALVRLPMSAALEQAAVSPQVREALAGVMGRARAALVQGIEDSLGFSLEALDLVAHTMLTLLQGAAIRLLVDPEGADLEALFDEFRRTVLLAVQDRMTPEQRRAFAARVASAARGPLPEPASGAQAPVGTSKRSV